MQLRFFVVVTIQILTLIGPCRVDGRAYFVSPDGNDFGVGTSPDHAWMTLQRASAGPLVAGDQLLLRRGGVWHETLDAKFSGGEALPIVISAYGEGQRPIIDGGEVVALEGSDVASVRRARVGRGLSTVWSSLGGELSEAHSLGELPGKENSFFCDGTWLYVHCRGPVEIPERELCVELDQSHVVLRSIACRHAGRSDRGAITVWAGHDLDGIDIEDCEVADNAGRGIWLCGPAAAAIRDVVIANNQVRDNAGSGLLMTLADGAEVRDNQIVGNCRRAIEPWQAGIRIWSGGIRDLTIEGNVICDQLWHHGDDSSMGIHCDETGPGVVIRGNTISDLDHAGIEIENCRGVIAEENLVSDCNNGIFIDRAGHDHIVRRNKIVDSRSHALLLLGWRAHGVNAGPEIMVGGRLMTRNLIEDNLCLGSRLAELRAGDGGARVDPPLGNIYRDNDFGPERRGFIEWGDELLDRYSQWPVPGGWSHK
jgi:hypothetical protein